MVAILENIDYFFEMPVFVLDWLNFLYFPSQKLITILKQNLTFTLFILKLKSD